MKKIVYVLKNEQITQEAGKHIAKTIQQFPHIRTILLYGTLGAGKTTFTRGFVSAFKGCENAEVSSPTFTLVNQYPTKPTILHADMYRLAEMKGAQEHVQPTDEIEEAFEDNKTIVLIEWAEFLERENCPIERLDIFFKIDNNQRSLVIEGTMLENEALCNSLQAFEK